MSCKNFMQGGGDIYIRGNFKRAILVHKFENHTHKHLPQWTQYYHRTNVRVSFRGGRGGGGGICPPLQTVCPPLESGSLLTSPMRGRGYSTHSVCVCVCLSVTTLAGATHTLRAQLRYQKKALDPRINVTVAIELKVLSSKVMTVCSSPQKL